jgi:hypothetical protein
MTLSASKEPKGPKTRERSREVARLRATQCDTLLAIESDLGT